MKNKSFFLEGLSKFSSSQNDYWLSYLTVPDNTNTKRKTLSALAATTVTLFHMVHMGSTIIVLINLVPKMEG